MIKKRFNPDKFECWVCGKTFPYFSTESPMVSDKVWKIVAADEPTYMWYYPDHSKEPGGGFLCKDCMEKRLGRPLKYEDLMVMSDGSPVAFNRQFIAKYFPEHSR